MKRHISKGHVLFGIGLFLVLYLLASNGITPLTRFARALYSVMIEFRLDDLIKDENFKVIVWTHNEEKIFEAGNCSGIGESLPDSTSYQLKMLFHGFSDKGSTSWTNTVKRAYHQQGDFVILSFDWESMAESPWYNSASKNTRKVGEAGAEVLKYLTLHHNLTWDRIHIIGSSLGAHAAGYAGRFTEGKVGRITGLDPSGPLFHSVGRADRLDSTDAQFVDIIHSAGRWVGNDDIQGHVDYFPNGGRAPQPGCEGRESLDLSCSHFRSWQFFAASINPKNKFLAVQCDSYLSFLSGKCCSRMMDVVEMGERAPRNIQGTYYLLTGNANPFSLQPNQSLNCNSTQLEAAE